MDPRSTTGVSQSGLCVGVRAPVIKTLVKVYGGWDSSKKTGFQFYDQQFVDYRGDVTLRVAVWIGSVRILELGASSDVYDESPEFPIDLTAHFDDGRLAASIANGRVSILVTLGPDLRWIVTSNNKHAVDWGPELIAQHRSTGYLLRQLIVFNLPKSRMGNYWERDLLPFLPGGLVERNKRRH